MCCLQGLELGVALGVRASLAAHRVSGDLHPFVLLPWCRGDHQPTPSALGRCRAPAHNKGPGPCFSRVALKHPTCMPTSKSSVGYCNSNCAPPVFAGWGLYPRTVPTPPGLVFAVHPKACPGAWHQAMPSAGARWHRAGFEAAVAGSKFTLSVLRQL